MPGSRPDESSPFSAFEFGLRPGLGRGFIRIGPASDAGDLTAGLRDGLARLAAEANTGGKSGKFEESLLDVMSLGQRFNYGQLAAFLARVEDLDTLSVLADAARGAGNRLPGYFSPLCTSPVNPHW